MKLEALYNESIRGNCNLGHHGSYRVILFGKRDRRWNVGMLLSVLLAVVLHETIDHYRIQMVPAYAVALVLIIVFIRRLAKPQSESQSKSKSLLKKSLLSIVVLAVSGVAVYLSLLLPVFTMPDPMFPTG